jgi:amidophosphoribosyltransferase
MSTKKELFAPRVVREAGDLSPETEAEMARAIGADTLRYLPISAIARSIGLPASSLCQACINGEYPTEAGRRLYQIACDKVGDDTAGTARTYDTPKKPILTRT